MAKRKTSKTKRKSIISSIVFFAVLLSVVISRFNGNLEKVVPTKINDANVSNETAYVHVINVGQGSSTLVQSGETGILIDAGENEYGQTVTKYLKKVGIKKLKYVVASHPHSDHIGGLLTVLENVDTDNIIMPRLTASNMPTTQLYERLLKRIDDSNINVIEAKYGSSYTLGNTSLTILGPVVQNKNLNNMSVICKVKAATTTFLLPGDAEKEEMSSIENYSPDLKCDVYVMAHHGSRTSLSKQFLKDAAFSVAVISCGKNNSYGHPHEEVLKYLKENKIEYYRTDKVGNIVFECVKKGYAISTSF